VGGGAAGSERMCQSDVSTPKIQRICRTLVPEESCTLSPLSLSVAGMIIRCKRLRDISTGHVALVTLRDTTVIIVCASNPIENSDLTAFHAGTKNKNNTLARRVWKTSRNASGPACNGAAAGCLFIIIFLSPSVFRT